MTHLGTPIQRCKAIGRHISITPHGQRMRRLEQRATRKCLIQLRAEAAEHEILKKDITRDLLRDIFDRARVGKAEGAPPSVEAPIYIAH